MVLQGEEVSLTKDILKKSIEFVKDWKEFQSLEGEQIFRSARDEIGATSKTLFTVPKNKTLFITNCFLSIDGLGNIATSTRISITENDFDLLVINQSGVAEARVNNCLATSYPMPIKVNENETVKLIVGSIHEASGGFVGFLLSKKIT